jgi:hypothetical protein
MMISVELPGRRIPEHAGDRRFYDLGFFLSDKLPVVIIDSYIAAYFVS